MVTTEEEFDVLFVSAANRSYRTGRALLLLLLVSLFVIILNLLTVGNECTDLLIEVINYDAGLLVFHLVGTSLKSQWTRNTNIVGSFHLRLLSIQVEIYLFFRGVLTIGSFLKRHIDKILTVFD